ncbi:MFS transporter [Halpernia frigidisoli]|uniref:Endo-1,3-beta-glucanase btgC n=1 Tax=Halpernia frigidisoli TaxID=1125876 RepID=A0A1I3FUL6_9FLAO|nr:MFS transporter [Halpernia frigidisoli]SFI14899.1 glycoside/pentoside/hexuronide:cation symporter, GPH family [Halpernia frigidisoli]
MDQNASLTQGKVAMGQKIAFGFGMLANQMFPAALGIFMVVLVQNLGFPTWMWGTLFFFPRIFDAFVDPIMGFITDNTRSVWGRRRQYVFIGAIIMGISFSLMWQMTKADGVNYNFVYFLLWSFVFYLGLSIFSVPYVAMGYEMSEDYNERTNIMAIAQWIGQWAWVIAPWFWVIMYDPKWFPSGDVATRTLAIWVGISCALLAMVPAFFIKSKSTVDETSYSPLSLKGAGKSLSEIFTGFKDAFSYPSFRKLCFSTFLIFNAFNTVAGFTFFIIVYYLFKGNATDAGLWPTLFGCVGALATTFIVIPIVAWMSKKMGKKDAFMLSQGISVFGYILLYFLLVPGKPYLFLFALPFFSFGIGSLFTIMMSMTADVCDLDELETGKRREGIFGAIYWWMVKFGFAIAGLLTGVIMTVVGFVPDAVNSPESVHGLRLFFSGLPIAGTLGAMWIMRNYDLTEEKAVGISAQIKERKAELINPSGFSETLLGAGINFTFLNEAELKAQYPFMSTSTIDFKAISAQDLKTEFQKVFNSGMHGICFSAYDGLQKPGDQITEDQIRRKLEVLKPHTKWIRVFSCLNGHENIPKIAKEMGLKTLVGAWINGKPEENELELQSLSKLINANLVDIAAVGNEVLFRNELSEETVIIYIQKIKSIANGIPVACVDVYYQFINRPNLTAACDIILANCYPFWEGVGIDNAGFSLQEMYQKTKNIANGKKVIITETGWPSKGNKVGNAEPSAENVMKYFIKIQNWAQKENAEMHYFSSFDESWKTNFEGSAGSFWGLWDNDENFKYQ